MSILGASYAPLDNTLDDAVNKGLADSIGLNVVKSNSPYILIWDCGFEGEVNIDEAIQHISDAEFLLMLVRNTQYNYAYKRMKPHRVLPVRTTISGNKDFLFVYNSKIV